VKPDSAIKAEPGVCVVIPAHARPAQLRTAIAAARDQEYEGALSVLVVYDRAEPDFSLECCGDRPVRVLANTRTPGLAGARNTGILEADAEWIAFCDDDDVWHPTKLGEQMSVVNATTHFVTCSIVVEYDGHVTPRLARADSVSHEVLVRSRMSMLHSSTFVIRRSSLLGPLGLVSEDIPGSQNEDWDLLLRASALAPITHVDRPLVTVVWGQSSHFSRRWDTKIASSEWMLDHHPAITADNRGAARLMGQIAFANSCQGARREAWRWARSSLRRDPRQWRAGLASAVALYPPAGEWALSALHRFGRGV
jgi:hypothetical protein